MHRSPATATNHTVEMGEESGTPTEHNATATEEKGKGTHCRAQIIPTRPIKRQTRALRKQAEHRLM